MRPSCAQATSCFCARKASRPGRSGSRRRRTPARAEGDALLSSLQAFAVALGGRAPPLARSVLPPQLEMLFRSAADLCTAGDLLRSEDLFTLE